MCCRLLPAAGPCLSMKKAQRLDFVVLSQINAIKSTNAAFRPPSNRLFGRGPQVSAGALCIRRAEPLSAAFRERALGRRAPDRAPPRRETKAFPYPSRRRIFCAEKGPGRRPAIRPFSLEQNASPSGYLNSADISKGSNIPRTPPIVNRGSSGTPPALKFGKTTRLQPE